MLALFIALLMVFRGTLAIIVVNPNSLVVSEYDDANLTCVAIGVSTITWEREGTGSLPDNSRLTITQSNMLNSTLSLFVVTSRFELSGVLYSDRGRYRCVANGTEVFTSPYAELTVNPKLRIDAYIRSSLVPTRDGVLRAPVGTPISLFCNGVGSLSWRASFSEVDGFALRELVSISPQYRNSRQIRIFGVSDRLRAVYTCSTNFPVSVSIATYLFFSADVSDPDVYIIPTGEGNRFAIEGTNTTMPLIVYTSSEDNLTIEWYHNGILINTINNPRYSVSTDMLNGISLPIHVLNIINVDRDVLGEYVVLVSVEGRNGSDRVQLSYPDPPNAFLVNGNVSTSRLNICAVPIFRCTSTGLIPVSRWTYNGGQPLPGPIRILADVESTNIFGDIFDTSLSGIYECTVTDLFGIVDISAGVFYVISSPTTTSITFERTGETSMAQRLTVITQQGNSTPTFLCSSDGYPLPTLTWSVVDEREIFPGGVTVSITTEKNSVIRQRYLVWNRLFVYTDSGLYQCVSTNIHGSSSVILDLLVQYPLIVNITYERTGETSRDQRLVVFAEQDDPGPTFSCVSNGHPMPNLTWSVVDERERFPNGVTETASTGITPITVQRDLVWSRLLNYTDSGLYECTSRNIFEENKVVLNLLVRLPLVLNITYERTGEISMAQRFRVIVEEGDPAPTFSCVSNGYPMPNLTWSVVGERESFPDGVTETASTGITPITVQRDLVWSRVLAYTDFGLYECTSRNIFEENRVVVDLIVRYSPLTNITYERTGEISMDQLFIVIAEQGDSALTFSCVSDSFPLSNITWSVVDESASFPDGVRESTSTVRTVTTIQRNLVWSRVLDYTDSGQYECMSQNIIGETSVVLDLLVQYTPFVTSIYPNSPVNSSISSFSNFLVPEGYSGTILTCAALGWPTPTIEWLKNGQALDGRIISDSTSNPDSAFVSARLRWTGGFEGSDVGDYTCIVRANDTNAVQSKSVSLNLTIPTTSSPNPIQCSVASLQTYFQIRVFDTECLSWDESLKGNISRNFLNIVLSIIVAECSECDVTTDDVEIIGPPTCSNSVDKAALFRGSISTQQMSLTEDIYCALSNWQQSRPIVQINNRYHLVDSNCSFMLDSPISAECPGYQIRLSSPISNSVIAGSVFAALLFLLLAITISTIIGWIVYKNEKLRQRFSINKSSIVPVFPRFNSYHSHVEQINT